MKRWVPVIYVVCAAALAVVFSVVYSQWKGQPVAPGTPGTSSGPASGKQPEQKMDLGSIVIEGPHMTGWGDDGKPLWEVWAKRVEVQPGREGGDKPRTVKLIEAHGNYYEQGISASKFTAGVIEVQVDQQKKCLSMSDKVEARWGARDVTLKSQSLNWDFTEKQITGQKGIQLTRGQWRLMGKEVIADLSMKRVKITGGARLEAVG